MSSINLSAIRNELYPGLKDITGRYPMIPTQWGEMYDKGSSLMALERTSNMQIGRAHV